MSKIQCPWCPEKVSKEEFAAHIDTHKNPSYDRKLIQESHFMHYTPPTGIDPEMITFTRCLARKLTPLPSPGEYPSGSEGVIARLVRRRVEYESEIYDILMGNKRFDVFFSNERRSRETNDLARMFHECLKGLHGEEARKLKESWRRILED